MLLSEYFILFSFVLTDLTNKWFDSVKNFEALFNETFFFFFCTLKYVI